MPFEVVDGVNFHVQRLGRGWRADEAGTETAAPVVMVHGLFTGSVASWFFTSAPVLARHRPVFLFDLRGHGRTERTPAGYASSTQAGDLRALTSEMPPFTLVGYSFGALVALRFAIADPQRVRALALIEPPIVTDEGRQWWSMVAGADPAGDPRSFDPEQWLANAGVDAGATPGPHRRLLETVRGLAAETTLLTELQSEIAITDAELASLPSPLLFVLGVESACMGIAPRVRRVRPDAGIATLASGHAVHLDARDELTEVLEKFVEAPAGPVGPFDPKDPRRTPGSPGDPSRRETHGAGGVAPQREPDDEVAYG